MTLRGSTQDFPLRAVLDLLAKTKKTGELQLRADDRAGALGIDDGRVVTAVLGEEEPLIALGAIFALDAAEFEFTPWDEAPPANLDGKSLDDLLRQAEEAKRLAEEKRRREEEEREAARLKAEAEAEAERQRIAALRALIPTDDVALRLSERAVEQGAVTLTSERWRLVLAVNGERGVSAIAAMLHLDQDTALTSLAALVRDGVIETIERAAPAVPAALPPAYEPPAYEPSESFTPSEPAAPVYQESEDTFAPAAEAEQESAPAQEAAPPPETATPAQDWITPDQAVPAPDWSTTSTEPTPISEVAPQWNAPPETAAQDWITPPVEPEPAMDDRLSALSGIFGPAATEPDAPRPAEPANSWAPPAAETDHWGTPGQTAPPAERWSAPPPAEPEAPATDDPWGTIPPPEKDAWVPPAQPARTWTAPTGGATNADPWGGPAAADARTAALSVPEPGIPPVEEWSPPPTALPEKKKRGLFGFGRERPAPPPVPGAPLPTADMLGSRVGMLAALANALIAQYNNGQYGKGRIEERISNLLMRVDEQADPIDRPLPIVDDRIDVEALERERLSESQALPYLALLVTTIFADAEKAFGKDKAKKGYKAAQQSVLLGDASALSTPELAGKLPRV